MSLTFQKETKGVKNEGPIAFFKEDRKKKIYVTPAVASMPDAQGHFAPIDHTAEKRVMVFKDELQPVPFTMKGQRSAVYVVGASGSGKSTFIANAIKASGRGKDVYLFTTATDLDPALAKLKKINKVDYVNDPEALKEIHVDDLAESICIFDDHDNSTNRAVNSTMQRLVNAILENGRKLKIDLYVVSHNPRDFLRTRTLILECDSYVVFPQTNRIATDRFRSIPDAHSRARAPRKSGRAHFVRQNMFEYVIVTRFAA